MRDVDGLCYDRDGQCDRLSRLVHSGVTIIDPRQTYVDGSVPLASIEPGAILYPGCRLSGPNLSIGKNAKVGTEGPAILHDVALDECSEVASGYLTDSVLLTGARAGANSHIRSGTILEEFASTAHCVGMKQTVLMSFVTTGSLINLCDTIISGGRSKRDHTEIGSGFIHFNFTPWGKSGDKATPTLVGDVYDGVFLDRNRIFLGGQVGVIGPKKIGFGAILGAGQIVRKDVADDTLYSSASITQSSLVRDCNSIFSPRKLNANLAFIENLYALFCWYQEIRRHFANSHFRMRVLEHALRVLDLMLAERQVRLRSYAQEYGRTVPAIRTDCPRPAPNVGQMAAGSSGDYLGWVQSLSKSDRGNLHEWLVSCGRNCWYTEKPWNSD